MSINTKIGNVINSAINIPRVSKFIEQGIKDPATFAARMMVLSFVSKDAVNCVIYTTQSATNKKIPEEKRPFVASLDLINGVLNVAGQLFAAKLVDAKFVPWLFGKNYSGSTKNTVTKELTTMEENATVHSRLMADNIRGMVDDVINNTGNTKNQKLITKIKSAISNIDIANFDKKELGKKVSDIIIKDMGEGSKNFKSFEKGLGLMVTALATTALVKRTIVPLIATPLAGKLSDVYNKKKAQQDANIINTVNDPTTKLANNKMSKVA